MRKHIPNGLTLLRVLAIPVLVLMILSDTFHQTLYPFALFAFIGITDYFDGYLARRWQVESVIGAFLDPAADKLLVTSILITLTAYHPTVIFVLPAIIIIFRELVMSMLREYLARVGQSHVLAVDVFGKYKTATQMLTIGLLLLPGTMAQTAGFVALYVSTILTVLSLANYISKLRSHSTLVSQGYNTL
jgi:CDP-diacylglycerol--glycerol-3-phosphate 3-phosphatidyltransferase